MLGTFPHVRRLLTSSLNNFCSQPQERIPDHYPSYRDIPLSQPNPDYCIPDTSLKSNIQQLKELIPSEFLTRFYSRLSIPKTLKKIEQVLTSFLVPYKLGQRRVSPIFLLAYILFVDSIHHDRQKKVPSTWRYRRH